MNTAPKGVVFLGLFVESTEPVDEYGRWESPAFEDVLFALSPIIIEVENGYILKGNYYWRDPFFTSMFIGGRVMYFLLNIWIFHCHVSSWEYILED